MNHKEGPPWHPVWMEAGALCFIDQRELPHAFTVIRSTDYGEAIQAIREMAVRGAGTIGVAGGFAMALAAQAASSGRFWEEMEEAGRRIGSARPTAKNLSYAVDRVLSAMRAASDVESARRAAASEAQGICDDDAAMTREIALAGVDLLLQDREVLTHCNAGWLAYPGWGSALAPIYLAHSRGRSISVIATETRPRSQGAKLTAWELSQAGIPHQLIADTAAGYLMRKGEIGMVIVGADRIAANGDTANKIGTYSLAVLAKRHGIPFYVAAPSPTFDAECPSGDSIPIEERDEREVLEVSGSLTRRFGALAGGEKASVRMANPATHARNPAFDVTPAELITAFLTESGVVPPTIEAIAQFLQRKQRPVILSLSKDTGRSKSISSHPEPVEP